MKTQYYAAAAVAVAGLIVSGCAAPRTTDATYPVNSDLSERRVYTQDQMKKTGRTGNVGEGLEALDPSVRVQGGR